VAEDERGAGARRLAEEPVRDLAVGAADPDLERPQQHLAVGCRDPLDAGGVRYPRLGDECTRHALRVSVDLLLPGEHRLAEGPRWDAAGRRLLFVDIERGQLHSFDGERDTVRQLDAMVGACAPCEDGDVLVALADRLALVDGGTLVEFPWPSDVRANDGVCDDEGRFWAGSMALDERPGAGALYRWDGSELVQQLDGLTISNGIGWSPDRTSMYFVDTPTDRIDVFDYDGEIANRRVFATIDRGSPDGLAVDDEGCIWVALHGGGAVQRFTPDGVLDRTVELPEEKVTACCFYEGALVITTRAHVYVTDVGVSGPPAQPFRKAAPSDADPTSAR
jgi:sugar lactone lactonase YvrE